MKTKYLLFLILTIIGTLILLNYNYPLFKLPSFKKSTSNETIIKKQLDSLKQIIDIKQKQIDSNKLIITDLKDSVENIDKKVVFNEYKIYNLDQEYDKKTSIINNYSSDQLYRYLSKRYDK
jgi:hypothetical protein